MLKIRGVSSQKKSASTKELDQDLTACSRRREGGLGRCVQCTGLEESQQNLCIAHCTVETAHRCTVETCALHTHCTREESQGKGKLEGGFCLCL